MTGFHFNVDFGHLSKPSDHHNASTSSHTMVMDMVRPETHL